MDRRTARPTVLLAAVGVLALVGGCSSHKSAHVYTYTPEEAGSVCSSDALGAAMVSSRAAAGTFATAQAVVAAAAAD